jgi:hypothetical protein
VAQGTPEEFKAITNERVSDFIHGRAPPNEDVATLLGG